RAVRAGLYRRGPGAGREAGPADSRAQRPARPEYPDRQRCRPDPPLPQGGEAHRRTGQGWHHRNPGRAHGVLPEAFRQTSLSQRRRGAGRARTQRMTPYHITELPWHADPLPGLLAIRDLGQPVLLDSAASGDPRGRYSILTADPVTTITCERDEPGTQTIARLRQAIQALGPATWPDQPLPFGAGALGYISYDCGRHLENLPSLAREDIRLPALQLGVDRWSLISDRQLQRRWLVCHPTVEVDYRHALLARLSGPTPTTGSFSLQQPFAAEQTRAAYRQSFDRIQHYIKAGDCYQVNLAQRFSAPCQGDPLAAYQQ